MPSSIYDSIRACFSSILLGENIINPLPGDSFIDKMAVCLHFYLQSVNINWLFVPIYLENQQSTCIWKLLGHVRNLDHMYCLFTLINSHLDNWSWYGAFNLVGVQLGTSHISVNWKHIYVLQHCNRFVKLEPTSSFLYFNILRWFTLRYFSLDLK